MKTQVHLQILTLVESKRIQNDWTGEKK